MIRGSLEALLAEEGAQSTLQQQWGGPLHGLCMLQSWHAQYFFQLRMPHPVLVHCPSHLHVHDILSAQLEGRRSHLGRH